MHDLRQRHCPIITPTLLCWKWLRFAPLLWSHCQLECKIAAQNKISRKVKLLACDLMWKICTPFLARVNSREKGEHPPYSRAIHVPAGGRHVCCVKSHRSSIVLFRQHPMRQKKSVYRSCRADSGDCGQGFRLNATMHSDRRRPPVPTKAAGVSLPA